MTVYPLHLVCRKCHYPFPEDPVMSVVTHLMWREFHSDCRVLSNIPHNKEDHNPHFHHHEYLKSYTQSSWNTGFCSSTKRKAGVNVNVLYIILGGGSSLGSYQNIG